MPSSTSVSDLRRATVWLIAGCLLIALGMEVSARVGLDRASRIQRRMVQEYVAARAIGQDGTSGHHVLVVGNSLLDEGVQFDRLRTALESRYDARRYMVEQTVYYDWYYGLKRLYREGARPDIVVVMLGTGHWLSANIRGDYSAQYMMSVADLPSAARDLEMHPTQATGFLFAGVSKFWGARVEMRNFVLGRLMPDVGQLMNFSSAIDRRPMVQADITPVTRRADRADAGRHRRARKRPRASGRAGAQPGRWIDRADGSGPVGRRTRAAPRGVGRLRTAAVQGRLPLERGWRHAVHRSADPGARGRAAGRVSAGGGAPRGVGGEEQRALKRHVQSVLKGPPVGSGLQTGPFWGVSDGPV